MFYTLITGASRGIGREIAFKFAENGHHLLLVARQENKLIQLSEELKTKHSIEVEVIPLDLSEDGAAGKVYQWTREHSVSVNYLVNNAGFYVKGAFSDTSWEEEQKLIQLQCINHIHLVKLLLPGMLQQDKGGILNVGSTGSFVPGPYNAVYCAAKAFLLSFTEALAQEVSGSGIRVTALCPGGTDTSFHANNQQKRSIFFPMMDASTVAAAGYRALMRGKRVVIPGRANRFMVWASRHLPRKLLVKLTGSMTSK